MLDAEGLGGLITSHYRESGDELFRMERLPIYVDNGPQTERWLTGAAEPDWSTKREWLDVLAAEHARGLVSRRVRIFTTGLTDDERASCAFGYAYNGRWEDIRILRRGEHPVVDVLDHDYWIITPASGAVRVVRMRYSDVGGFVGAEEVPAEAHAPYLREQRLAWAIAENFSEWWGRHGELHRRLVA